MKKSNPLNLSKTSTFKLPLLKISFTITLFGILLLLFLSNLEPRLLNISELSLNNLDKKVKIQAKINKIRNYIVSSGTLQILEVSDLKNSSAKTEVLLTNPNKGGREGKNPKKQLLKNQNITVIGKITQYQDSLQVQAEKIKV